MTRIQQTLLGMGMAGLVGHWVALGLTNMANAEAYRANPSGRAFVASQSDPSVPPLRASIAFAKDIR